MRLTLLTRLLLCWELLTAKAEHEKGLPLFQRGYKAGLYDRYLTTIEGEGE
jgi:hypothetical protein